MKKGYWGCFQGSRLLNFKTEYVVFTFWDATFGISGVSEQMESKCLFCVRKNWYPEITLWNLLCWSCGAAALTVNGVTDRFKGKDSTCQSSAKGMRKLLHR